MRFFILLFLILPLLSFGQALKDNFYLNSVAGFSIKFDKDWKVKIPDKATHLVFAAKSRYQTISVSVMPISSDLNPPYSEEEKKAIKEALLKEKPPTVIREKITVSEGKFSGKTCFIVIEHLKDKRDENGVLLYHKTIQLVHKGYIFYVRYNLPVSKLSATELQSMEKQIQTAKFF